MYSNRPIYIMLICVYVGPYMYLRMCARHMLPKFKMSQTYSNNIYLTMRDSLFYM